MPIYKYVTSERVDVLQSGLIRFTHPGALNDPFDLKPHFKSLANRDFIMEQLSGQPIDLEYGFREAYSSFPEDFKKQYSYDEFMAKFRSQPGADKMILDGLLGAFEFLFDFVEEERPEYVKALHDAIQMNLGILSLSTIPDSNLMWTHYAANHSGFVIVLDASTAFFDRRRSPDDECYHLREVVYREGPNTHETLVGLTGVEMLLWKGKEWDYEQEQRIVAPLQEADRVVQREGDTIHLFELPAEAVTGVILGAKMSSADVVVVQECLRENTDLNHVALQCAEVLLPERRIVIRDM